MDFRRVGRWLDYRHGLTRGSLKVKGTNSMRFLLPVLLTALVSLSIASRTAQSQLPSAEDSASGSIVLNVTVASKSGEAVMDLDRSAFTVYDNNVVQQINYFEKTDQPLSVGIILGTQGPKVGLDRHRVPAEAVVKQGLSGFINASHKSNKYFLANFHLGKIEYLSDWTQDGSAIIDSVGRATFRAGPLVDACYDAVEKLINEGDQKRVLLVFSDGRNFDSRRTLEELRRLIRGSDVLIYCVPLASFDSLGSSSYLEGEGVLYNVANDSGGRFYEPRKFSMMSAIFELIALELGHQYSIGYTPSRFADDGKEHRVKVKVKAPTDNAGKLVPLVIKTRETYLSNRRLLKTGLKPLP